MTEVTVTERRLATIRRIAALDPIPGADKIVRATVDGWELVTAIDNGFKVGDLVVYLEIDSWVPFELAPFLTKGKEPKVFNGVKGERLKTIKLRGCTSQGLILPLSVLEKVGKLVKNDSGNLCLAINKSVPLNCEDTNANLSNFEQGNQ